MKQFKEFLNEAKKTVDLPGSLIELTGFSKDKNGNTVVKLVNGKTNKGFSIQTNTNLPKTHGFRDKKTGQLSDSDLKTIAKEVKEYISEFGTKAMK